MRTASADDRDQFRPVTLGAPLRNRLGQRQRQLGDDLFAQLPDAQLPDVQGQVHQGVEIRRRMDYGDRGRQRRRTDGGQRWGEVGGRGRWRVEGRGGGSGGRGGGGRGGG